MKDTKLQLNKIYKILLILIVVFFSIYILNHMTLYISDDFLYRFELRHGVSDDDLQPINGLLSLVRSQISHYTLWNGRFVAHTIVQFFLQFDKWIFNLVNTIVYIFLGLLILMISSQITKKEINTFLIMTVFIFMFFLIPDFGQTVLWMSGAANYLWMSVIYLGFYFFNIKHREDNWKTITTASILGLLSGATNENSGPAVILMVILLAIYAYYQQREINLWRISGIISSIIGFSLILFAPAATKRVSERNEVSLSVSSLFDNFLMLTRYIINNYWIYFIIITILLCILVIKREITANILLNIFIIFAGFFGATYSLVVVDKIIERTMFGPTMLLITIMMILLSIWVDVISNDKLLILMLIPFILMFAFVYKTAFLDIHNTYTTVSKQYEIISNNINEDVKVPMISTPQSDYNAYSNGTNYLKEDKDAWLNKWAARFFGVNSISGDKKSN